MNFRKLGTILLGLSAALMLSCSDSDTGDGPAAGDGLTVSPLTIEAGATAETHDIEIKTKAPWEAQANKDFIKVSPSWGIGNATMVITVEKNRTQEKRSAVVVVWIDEENAREITITQAAGTEAPAGERKFYVTGNGSTDNSGLYWDEPTTLEWALGEAVAGEEIHIAAGTYTPTKFLTSTETSGDDCNKTFEINKNITLIGGYPVAPEEGAVADPALNKTILSGKLSETANAYHVMVISAPLEEGKSVKVKGLYIQDGIAVAKAGPTVNGEACQTRNGGGLVVQGAPGPNWKTASLPTTRPRPTTAAAYTSKRLKRRNSSAARSGTTKRTAPELPPPVSATTVRCSVCTTVRSRTTSRAVTARPSRRQAAVASRPKPTLSTVHSTRTAPESSGTTVTPPDTTACGLPKRPS